MRHRYLQHPARLWSDKHGNNVKAPQELFRYVIVRNSTDSLKYFNVLRRTPRGRWE